MLLAIHLQNTDSGEIKYRKVDYTSYTQEGILNGLQGASQHPIHPVPLTPLTVQLLMTVHFHDRLCILNLPFQPLTYKLNSKALLTSFHRSLNNSD